MQSHPSLCRLMSPGTRQPWCHFPRETVSKDHKPGNDRNFPLESPTWLCGIPCCQHFLISKTHRDAVASYKPWSVGPEVQGLVLDVVTGMAEDTSAQHGSPRRASSLMPQLAGLGNGLLVSVSQDIAFCRVFRSDLFLSLTEVSHLYKGSNGGGTSRSPAPLPFHTYKALGRFLAVCFCR